MASLKKVIDFFVFQSGEQVQKLVDGVLTEEEKDILQQQELTAEGRFPKPEGTMNCPIIHLFS